MSIHPSKSRKFLTLVMALTLCWTTLACGSPAPPQSTVQNSGQPQDQSVKASPASANLADGQYPTQQVTYDDATGEYSLFLLDTPSGTPPLFRTADLQMARLTDAEVKAGQKSYLKIDNGQASLHVPEDFKIEYVHTVTETQTNPQTGQPQTVAVGRESSFWTPFAGALAGNVAGQVVGNLLFRPQYYVPPVYQPGVPLTGYGGYGRSYGQAVNRYQSRYQAPPAAVRNRQILRTTGGLRAPATSTLRRTPRSLSRDRATGSGFGSSNLRQSDRLRPTRPNRSSGSFGSGQRSTGFGSGRRSLGGARRR